MKIFLVLLILLKFLDINAQMINNLKGALDSIKYHGTIIINHIVNVDTNVVVPDDVLLKFTMDGRINVKENFTLTLNCPIEANLHPIFILEKNAQIKGNPKIEYVYPEWFYQGDWSDAIINSMKLCKTVKFSTNRYDITKTIDLGQIGDSKEQTAGIFLIGNGMDNTVLVNHINNGGDLHLFKYDKGYPLYRFKISDLTIESYSKEEFPKGNDFFFRNFQSCVFEDINVNYTNLFLYGFKSYFNIFRNIKSHNCRQFIVLNNEGETPVGDPNFNTFENITINNWGNNKALLLPAIDILGGRGNIFNIIDAENNSTGNIGPAIRLYNSSCNYINYFWYEAGNKSVAPEAILITAGTDSSSYNKSNIIEDCPQILKADIGISISNSINCKIIKARFNNTKIGVKDTHNVNLQIIEAQLDANDSNDKLYDISSSTTSIYNNDSACEFKKYKNTQLIIDSEIPGYNGITIRSDGVEKAKIQVQSDPNIADVTFSIKGGQRCLSLVENSGVKVERIITFHQSINENEELSVPNNTLYWFNNGTENKLKYKDASGVSHSLY